MPNPSGLANSSGTTAQQPFQNQSHIFDSSVLVNTLTVNAVNEPRRPHHPLPNPLPTIIPPLTPNSSQLPGIANSTVRNQISGDLDASNVIQRPIPSAITQPPHMQNPLLHAHRSSIRPHADIGEHMLTGRPAKRVRFSNLADLGHSEAYPGDDQPDFRSRGSPSAQLPQNLIGPYVGQINSKLVLRVHEYLGAQILACLLQEGITVEQAIRNRFWRRNANSEPFQSEAEALTHARVVHLTLMAFPTVEDALENAPWLETSLRRLYALLYVESRASQTPRPLLWSTVRSTLEVYPNQSLSIAKLDKLYAQQATLRSSEQKALYILAKNSAQKNNTTKRGQKATPNKPKDQKQEKKE